MTCGQGDGEGCHSFPPRDEIRAAARCRQGGMRHTWEGTQQHVPGCWDRGANGAEQGGQLEGRSADGHHLHLRENCPSLRAASRTQVLGSHGHTGGAVMETLTPAGEVSGPLSPQVLWGCTVRGTHLIMLSQSDLQTMSLMLLREWRNYERLSLPTHPAAGSCKEGPGDARRRQNPDPQGKQRSLQAQPPPPPTQRFSGMLCV